MTADDFDTILLNNWNSGYVDTPDILQAPQYSHHNFRRGIVVKRMQKIEDYMGIISRKHYTPESHDAWNCYIVSDNEDDCVNMVNEIRRICSQFQPTATEKILQWEGGDWELFTTFRYVFRFIVFVRISGTSIPNA